MQAPEPRRKLIEAALPLEAVNAAGRAEKAVPKKGHPATLHLWWSRKPLGVARAVLFASLVDDPSARPDLYPTEEAQNAERRELFELVEALARWDRSDDSALLQDARQRIDEASDGDRPRLIEPFCGGGSIAVEGVRLGLDVTAVDLNPVAALVTSSAVGVAQRFAVGRRGPPVNPGAGRSLAVGAAASRMAGMADDVWFYGEAVERECRRRLRSVFADVDSPDSPGGTTVAVSYLWARTVVCANPGCRRETPLLSTWWLCKRPGRQWHARPVIDGGAFTFTVHRGGPPEGLDDLKAGRGAVYRCLFCGTVNDADAVRAHGASQGCGLRLVAVQGFRDPAARRSGRIYLDPDPVIERAALAAAAPVDAAGALEREIPGLSGNITAFGVRTFGDLLTPRQRLTMWAFAEAIRGITDRIRADALAAGLGDDPLGIEKGGAGALAYAEAVTTYLGLTLSRLANRTSTMTIHNRANGSVEQSFVQPAYAFYGDFPEANPFSGSTGSWGNALEHVCKAVAALPDTGAAAEVRAASMLTALSGERGVVSTDPPYYDMFDYSALSNLFHVWLREGLGGVWPEALGPLLAPAAEQIVSNPARFDGDRGRAHQHFEGLLRQAFAVMREVQDPRFPMTIYYGYQQTERSGGGRGGGGRRGGGSGGEGAGGGGGGTAWEALLESVMAAGLRVTSTWPLRTERPEGVKKGSNSLATSILLVCRPALAGAETATVADFRRALRERLPGEMELLRQGSIAPVDLAQATIGPGMAVFTSFRRVVEADGSVMGVRGALKMINRAVDEALEGGGSDLDAATRWAVTWFEDHGFEGGDYGRAEQLSKSRNISVAGLAAAGVVVAGAGRVRLLRREEMDDGWDARVDRRVTVWGAAQRLIRALEVDGEAGAAALLGRFGGGGEAAAVRELSYRLFRICIAKGWAAEGASLNGLVAAWPELTRLAQQPPAPAATAAELDFKE